MLMTLFCLIQIKQSPPDAKFKIEKKIRVKLTGDGTNIGKRLHIVNFGFTLLDEGDKAYSAAGMLLLLYLEECECVRSHNAPDHNMIKSLSLVYTFIWLNVVH